MVRTLMALVLTAFLATPALADTKNGNANPTSWQRWQFTSPGGEVNVTFTWTNANVRLEAVAECGAGTTGVIVAVTSGNGLDRVANFAFGVPSGIQCVIFVRTLNGSTSYRMSVRNAITQDTTDTATVLQLAEDTRQGDYAEALAQQTLDMVRLNTP